MANRLIKGIRIGVLSFAAIGFLAGCASDDETGTDSTMDTGMEESTDDMTDDSMQTEEDIVAVAQGNPDFSILVSALQEANLVETLQGDGPFTVFAPTDEAFEALLTELDITAEELLAQPDLESILTYHVIPSEVMAGDLEDGQTAETVNGEELTFDLSGDPMVNESAITMTDIEASNGLIHAIDKVLVPSNFELQE
ncbi:Uncaracterized surface protein containing fasciclin (FAS1) repeats [Alkalibacterium gilvum]|uniref:Uncaracterized surface protein containing fasciclin (FAS1) repeats n=2 Tax=Alkalibacterium TaxID=99906 RepID=A0A1H6S2B5_9LACT|nr:fasciclin domain-containing protein [Alkalibacterium gilvum]SEI62203.1 Uncaracterized surface protein containing fasciclin (FAS1) repeats [Alkalibacterium gilvum]